MQKFNLKIRKLLPIVSVSDSLKFKNYLFAPFHGISKKRMELISREFTEQVLLAKEHLQVMQRLQWHQHKGHTIVLLSGGFETYLKYYASIYSIEYVIGTTFLYDNQDQFQGIGQECIGNVKVDKLRECINLDEYDLKNSYAYSDAESDLPMLRLVGNSFVVKNMQNIRWKEKNWEVIEITTYK